MGTADKDYFLDDQGNVTTDETKAATLLVRKGQDMSKDVADKIGNTDEPKAKASKATAEEPADAASDETDEGSAKAAKPAANKAVKSKPKNKSGVK